MSETSQLGPRGSTLKLQILEEMKSGRARNGKVRDSGRWELGMAEKGEVDSQRGNQDPKSDQA